jgi:hypothetical protein
VFEIEKGVPVPEKATGGRRPKYPFENMSVGDSFFVPGKSKMASTVASAEKRLGFKFKWAVVTHKGVDGVRIWRVEK